MEFRDPWSLGLSKINFFFFYKYLSTYPKLYIWNELLNLEIKEAKIFI